MQRVKIGKKKNDQTDLKWRHSTEAVEKGKITYTCKLLGSTPVTKSKGSEIIKEAIKKLQFANDIKKSEEGLKASKLKKVELSVSVQSLLLTDTKSKTTLYNFPLQRISYCADDKSSKRLFGFIAREKESPQHHCYILESEKNAEELTLAVGQAFDLAYKKYKANQEGATGTKEVVQMKQRVESTEKENEVLKKRLEELERSQQGATAAAPENSVEAGNDSQLAVPDSGNPIFDPFSGSEDLAFESTNASVEDPFALHTDSGPSESFPAGVGSNPFAAIPQEAPPTNQNDLLNMFTTENPPVTSQDEDPFDPLAQMNGLSSPQANTQQEISTFPSFDGSTQSQQKQAPAPSVSRPKPPTLSGGLLPPPPTKQSMKASQKEKFKSLAPTVQQDSETHFVDPFAEFGFSDDQGSSLTHNQGIKDVQDGVQNNLVLF